MRNESFGKMAEEMTVPFGVRAQRVDSAIIFWVLEGRRPHVASQVAAREGPGRRDSEKEKRGLRAGGGSKGCYARKDGIP